MKNKKIKKYLACFLTATCMMSMLTGCGNTEVKQTEKTEESKKESTEAASTSTENASEESVEEPAGVTYPMENVTLTIALLEESAITSYYNDISETPFGQAWQEATGVTLEVQQYADNAALNLMIASGELPDIIYFDWAKYNGGIYQAVKDGVVAPMSDYAEFSPDYMALLESNDTYRKGATTVDGDVAGFNLFRGDPYLLTSAGLIVRPDFLDKVDMEAPVTADDLYDVLVAFVVVVSVAFDVVWVEVEGQEEKVQSLAVSAAAAGGSEVYDEYTIQVYESDTLVLEAANQKVIVTPAVSGKTYQAVVTVKDSRGTVATAEKNIVFSE